MFNHSFSPLLQVLIALVLIILVTRIGGWLFKKADQPQVMGEIVGGILLGPSFFGWLAPGFSEAIMPAPIVTHLNMLAQVGIIFYMFLIGLEVDLDEMKQHMRSTLIISNISILVPFILGIILSIKLYASLAPAGLGFTSFALFVGISLSITAFPILARILTDKNLHKTSLGKLALTCAAINDIMAWCLMALVVSVASSRYSNAFMTIAMTIGYVIAMIVFIRPILKSKLASHSNVLNEKILVTVFAALLISSATTELIGIHALFGAFLFGAIVPHDHELAKNLHYRLYDFIRLFFLPIFFAYTGLRTKINLVSTPTEWLYCAMIIAVAIFGKFGGTYMAARLSGYKNRPSAALGILMNTRGLVELIVLNIGLDLGILTPTLYTMLVIMALVTTFMTGPLIKIIKSKTSSEGTWEI